MNIHGHCYVLPLAAVGAAQLPLQPNTNMNHVNNSQLSTAVNCGINPLSMSNNGTVGAQSNSAGIQGTNYPPMHHETSTKYLLGAQNLLPNLLQDHTQHPRQPHHSLIHLNPNHQINHAALQQHLQQQQQHLLSIPYQTNNLQTATLTPAFHPSFFATPSLPRSTSNLSNLSNFSSQHHSPKNVQQLGQVAATVHHVAASGHQHLQHHNMQNCTQPSPSHSNPHHGHQQMQDHVMSRQQMQNVSSQSILQATEQPQLYNPFLTSASLLSASNMIPKAPLLQTPALGKECNGSGIGGFSKESIVYGTTVTPQNVINSNACIGSKNLINSMNTTTIGRSNVINTSKRKLDDTDNKSEVKKAKLETKALKAKRPGFTDERYNETSYYHEPENNLRKVYPYYFTFTTFTKGRWVGERILDVFAREFRAHPATEYERCIKAGTLTVNYEQVTIDYRLKHNDLLANIVHRHEVPVSNEKIKIIHIDEDLVVVNKPASIPVHPCGRYRHNTVVFILAKEYGLKNLRTIHRLDRLTSGLLLFGRNPKKAREMEQHIRTRQVKKAYVCRVEGEFPSAGVSCKEPIEVVSYKIGVCKVSPNGKECQTDFQRLSCNGKTSVVLCHPRTGRMHQIRVHLQYLGYPVVNDPLYNHEVFGPEKGKHGNIGKTDEQLIQDLISIHNAENWLGMDIESEGGNVLCSGIQDRSDGCSTVASSISNDKALRVEASSTTKTTNGTMHFNLERKTNSPGANETVQSSQATQTSSSNTISTSIHSETNYNITKGTRSETPDSAVDVNSLPASADSPSSSSSTASSYSSSIQFQTNQNSAKNSTSTSTSMAIRNPSPNVLDHITCNEVAGNSIPPTSTFCVSSNLGNCINSIPASSSTISPNLSSIQQAEALDINNKSCVTTIATQTGIEEADERFDVKKLTFDSHCYECKVKYRDPSPKDLVMFLHAYTYTGPDWVFKTDLPSWAEDSWIDPEGSD